MPSGLRAEVMGLCSTRRLTPTTWDGPVRFSEPVSAAKSKQNKKKVSLKVHLQSVSITVAKCKSLNTLLLKVKFCHFSLM